MARRERESELVFRGEQYARAIMLFQRKYAGTFPPNIDVLVNEHFLRKKYKDPISNDDFQLIGVGQGASQAQTTDPLARSGAGGPVGARGATGGVGQAGIRGGTTALGGVGGATPPQQGSRAGFVLGSNIGSPGASGAAGARAGGIGATGASAGIMGVTSKSTDASLRVYKGADHYNQWLFIATQASTQAGGRGAQSPGQGVRGGAPPGGPGGRGTQPPPTMTPFSVPPFGRGQPPTAPPGRGRF
jgi:hypothetical protein